MIHLYTPLKMSENQKFSDVFRGIEMEHWAKMVQNWPATQEFSSEFSASQTHKESVKIAFKESISRPDDDVNELICF